MALLFAAHGADRHGCALRWGCLPPAGERRSGCRRGGRRGRRGETATPGPGERRQQRGASAAATQRAPGPTTGWCPTSNRPWCPDRGQLQPASASQRRRSTGYCKFHPLSPIVPYSLLVALLFFLVLAICRWCLTITIRLREISRNYLG